MNKTNTKHWNTITAAQDELAFTDAQMEFIYSILKTPTKVAVDENPDYTDDNGQLWHYCIGHQRYEKASEFKLEKGKLMPNCITATKQWTAITKDLNKAKSNLLEADADTFKYCQNEVKRLDNLRKGPFEILDDEVVETVKPTRKSKE